MSEPKPGEIYRHYKRGWEYRIVCVAVIEATEEPCVVYEALYEHAEHRFWVRPLEEFCMDIEWEGKLVPRFKLI
jgi:hypothetical protein